MAIHSLGSFIHLGGFLLIKSNQNPLMHSLKGRGQGISKARTRYREIWGNPRPKQLCIFLTLNFQRFPETLHQKLTWKLYIQAYTIQNIFTTECLDVHNVRLLTCMFCKLLKEFISVSVFRNVPNKQAVVVKRNGHAQLFSFPQLKII